MEIKEIKFWSKVDVATPDLCWNWRASKLLSGYGQTGITQLPRLAHRAAWFFTYGEIPKRKNVLHKCDNPSCCNPNHLFIGTQFDNLKDMTDKGRRKTNRKTIVGTKNGRCKLTDKLVREIRNIQDMSEQAIANQYGIGQTQVSRILRREQWTHI